MSWQTMVNDPAINEALREFYWNARIVENAGKAEQYLSVHFLGDEAMQPQTEAQVQSLIDQFLQAVRRGDVSIRPDQSAWQSFTGMWGKSRDLRLDEDEAARRYFGDKA
jgi:hypothetical protein